jgi:hypothetical protein
MRAEEGTEEETWVGVNGINVIAQLARVLREGPGAAPSAPNKPIELQYPRHRRWKIRDRFSKDEIAQIVNAFKAGTPKHVLAKRYDMNLRSLKTLLREEGARRKSWKAIQGKRRCI